MFQLSLRFSFSFCFCLFICLAAPAQSRWTPTGISSDSSLWYLDRAVTKTKSGTVAAWEKVVYPDEAYGFGLSEWNCSEKKKRLLQSHSFDASGEVIGIQRIALPWRFVTPDSIEEITFNIVCAGSISKRRVVEKADKPDAPASFAQVIRKSALVNDAGSSNRVIRKVAVGEKLLLVSEESSGIWYEVFDQRTGMKGWLNGNHFKIVKNEKPTKRRGRNKVNM